MIFTDHGRVNKEEERKHLLTLLFTGLAGNKDHVLKTFKAPRDTKQFLSFYGSYRALGWDYKQAIKPYKKEELMNFNLHRDDASGEYSYSVPQHKGFRGIRIVSSDDEE